MNIFSTEPQTTEEYFIYSNDKVIYLEMETSEVMDVLGKPDEIEITKWDVPLHNFDVVCWKYKNGLWLYFFDIASYRGSGKNIITYITIQPENTQYKIGTIFPTKSTLNEVETIYGKPRSITRDVEYQYYNYEFVTLEGSPYSHSLRFRFTKEYICDEIIYVSNKFYL
jgi:hypothetical protein